MTIPGPSDNCGNCVTAERSITVVPHSVRFAADHSFRADYRCPACGHTWFTSWLLDGAEYQQAAAALHAAETNADALERDLIASERQHGHHQLGRAPRPVA